MGGGNEYFIIVGDDYGVFPAYYDVFYGVVGG